jgi:Arf-GAP/coiled-coil/ANK repeat/PH domain-containing protein
MMTQIEVPQIICLLTFSLMVFFRQVHNIMKETDGPIKDNLEKINARVATKNKVIENMKLEKKELETKLFNKKEVDKNLTKKEGFVNIRENENNSNFKRIFIRMNEGNLIYFKTKKQNLNLKEEDNQSKIYLNMIERIDIKEYYDLCNLLLSNVKKNEKKYEYPFCFEITDASTSKTFLLQADTEYETEEWICTVQNAISDRISNFHEIKDFVLDGKNSGKKNAVDNIKEENDDDINNKKIDDIINNNICADCGAKNPTWLCLNWLSIICIDCSAIHRSLGANISKVKGFRLDNISNDIIELLENIKQSEINEILEKNLKDDEKPKPESKYNIKEQFIIEKYKNKKYIDNNNLDMNNENIGEILLKIIEDNNLLDIYKYIKNDYDITNKIIIVNGEEYELLHYCAFKGKIQIIKLLYALGVDINKEDNKGLKPIIYAKLNKKTEVIEYLGKKEKI